MTLRTMILALKQLCPVVEKCGRTIIKRNTRAWEEAFTARVPGGFGIDDARRHLALGGETPSQALLA
jgi:hypothetical protein